MGDYCSWDRGAKWDDYIAPRIEVQNGMTIAPGIEVQNGMTIAPGIELQNGMKNARKQSILLTYPIQFLDLFGK